MVRQTSIEAYRDLQDIGNRQQIVFDVLKLYPHGLTDREIAEKLGYDDPNKIRPRRFELVEKGLLIELPKRICSVSGKKALAWARA
jgi:hypothetical protein